MPERGRATTGAVHRVPARGTGGVMAGMDQVPAPLVPTSLVALLWQVCTGAADVLAASGVWLVLRPRTYQVISSGLCLSVQGGSFQNSAAVIQEECNGQPWQKWWEED